jgi:hypothetical protein
MSCKRVCFFSWDADNISPTNFSGMSSKAVQFTSLSNMSSKAIWFHDYLFRAHTNQAQYNNQG